MENLFNLEMDQTTTILMSLIVLFSANNAKLKDPEKCSQNQVWNEFWSIKTLKSYSNIFFPFQEFFTQMLYRYLCSTVGRVNSTRLMPKYMYLISQLEEMAQIMITKRLML